MYNQITIVGHLGKDPETNSTQGGNMLTKITVATSESWRDKQTGERNEETQWHTVVFFGKLAEIAEKYLSKGSLVMVVGQVQYRTWEDRDGNKKYFTEVRARDMKMLDKRGDSARDAHRGKGDDHARRASNDDGDIPF